MDQRLLLLLITSVESKTTEELCCAGGLRGEPCTKQQVGEGMWDWEREYETGRGNVGLGERM